VFIVGAALLGGIGVVGTLRIRRMPHKSSHQSARRSGTADVHVWGDGGRGIYRSWVANNRGRLEASIVRLGVVVLGVAALSVAGCGASHTNTVVTKTDTVTVTASDLPPAPLPATASPASAPSDTIPGEGTYRVGIDVQPGNYKSSPAGTGLTCYGFRLSDLSGDFSSNINAVEGDGPVYVTIQPSDAGFKSQGCQIWERVN
jgi:hypothetical protein